MYCDWHWSRQWGRLGCFIIPSDFLLTALVYTYMKLTQPVPAGGAIQTKLRFVVGRWLTWDATTLHMNWFPNWWSDIIPRRKRQRKETVTRVNGSLRGANRPGNASAMCFITATPNEKTPGVWHQLIRINANENTGAGLCLSQSWLHLLQGSVYLLLIVFIRPIPVELFAFLKEELDHSFCKSVIPLPHLHPLQI